VDDERLIVAGSEAHHLKKVLRAKIGDSFYAIDGTGLKYRVVIESVSGSTVTGLISNVTRLENEPFHHITLAMGICRPSKMDLIVEKGTEIGVSSFIFYYSEKSYLKIKGDSSSVRRISRLQKIVRAAAKQSKRSVIPSVMQFKTFAETLGVRGDYDRSLLADSSISSRTIEQAVRKSHDLKKLLLLIGPESGLTDDEISLAIDAGFSPVRLGPRRLRAETAGVIFPTLVLNYLGDL
jgi:16S rRNA (uracil1498-N3)-methyltransferase